MTLRPCAGPIEYLTRPSAEATASRLTCWMTRAPVAKQPGGYRRRATRLAREGPMASRPRRHSKGLHVACHRSNTRRLTGTSTIYNRVEVGFGLGTTTATLEVRSLLDRKRHVVDVAVNLR